MDKRFVILLLIEFWHKQMAENPTSTIEWLDSFGIRLAGFVEILEQISEGTANGQA